MLDGLPPLIDSLDAIAADYDGFLIDQWGVLHDGVTAFPAALAALARLRAQGKRIVILSNSGRSGAENARLMAGMGIDAALFDTVLSAGDDALDALSGRRDPDYRALGPRVWLFSRPGDAPAILEHGYLRADSVEAADFLFVHSMEALPAIPEAWLDQLRRARARDLPLICANPDATRVQGSGAILTAPGAVAQAYAELGGRTHYHGKPWPRIYRTALHRLGLPAARVLAIGDSLVHDVRGATAAGIDSLFVVDGIHREAIDLTAPATLRAELARFPQDRPTAIIARLT